MFMIMFQFVIAILPDLVSHFAGKPGRACEDDDYRSSSGVSNHPDVSTSCTGLSGEPHSRARIVYRL